MLYRCATACRRRWRTAACIAAYRCQWGACAATSSNAATTGCNSTAQGRAFASPGESTIPAAARVRSYPAVEQHGFIWVWMGDAARADATKITSFPWMTKPGWQQTKLHARIQCNYQLIIDNLLDLSHLAFVHATTVGSIELADKAQVKTVRTPEGSADQPLDAGCPARDRTYARFGRFDGNVDRWQISESRAPCTLIIRNGAAKAETGVPEGEPGEQRWEFMPAMASPRRRSARPTISGRSRTSSARTTPTESPSSIDRATR